MMSENFKELKSVNVALDRGFGVQFVIKMTVKFLVESYGLTVDEADELVKVKILGCKNGVD